MNEYINIYMDNPTAGEQDGTAVSLEDAGNAPLTAVLDASKNESKTLRCALRCQEGYRTAGETTLSFAGTTADKWSLSATETGAFAATLKITESIGTGNTLFWVKASASSEEKPGTDTSVKLVCKAPVLPDD